jgi:hypothetical protein
MRVRRRSSVERANQRANGLPDDKFPDTGWRKGAGGTEYMQVHLEVDTTPTDKAAHSLFLNDRGGVTRPVRVGDGEGIIDPIDSGRLK